MSLIRHISLLLFLAGMLAAAPVRHVSFNDDWRFFKGEAAGAEAPNFADSTWRQLRLPHDWAIEGPFDSQYSPNTGGLPISGTGWYRKHFRLPAADKGHIVTVDFDGAMSNARVWLNGAEVGFRPYGYSSFEVDLTKQVKWGEDNVLAVRLTPEPNSSRWYPGAGIYRNVWLNVTNPVRVGHWGAYVTTPGATADKATVSIATTVEMQETCNSKYLKCIKEGVIASLRGAAPIVAVEFARKAIFSANRPSSDETDAACREVKASGGG